MNDSFLPDSADISRDAFLGGRLLLRQPVRGYRAGIDPVLLAASVQARPGQTVLDLGCGIGTAGLCLLARRPDMTVTGIELQPDLADLARRNARDNRMEDRFTVIEGSLAPPPAILAGRTFDQVITNPPWYDPATHRAPAATTSRIGHMEGDIDLAAWLKAATAALAPKGRLTVIHRADRLGDLLTILGKLAVGAIRIRPIHPKPGRPAIRVLISARKGARTPLELAAGLVLHDEDGTYGAAADSILRHATALD